MRSTSFVPLTLVAALAAPTPLPAQIGDQPGLALTILGGTVTGHGLWTVAKQPLTVLNTTTYDTLRVSRAIGASVVLGAAATYFPTPHVGVHLEFSYLGLPTEASCTGVFYNADTLQRNAQICDDIQATGGTGGAVSVFTGVTLRAAPRGTISPYVRGNVGLVILSRGTIEVVGRYVDNTGSHARQVIADPSQRRASLLLGGTAGVTSPIGTGYQLRLEVRDAIAALERLTGPANALGVGPTETRSYHHWSFVIGLDVVLERKRGRRY